MVSQLILQVGRVPTLPEPDVEDWGPRYRLDRRGQQI